MATWEAGRVEAVAEVVTEVAAPQRRLPPRWGNLKVVTTNLTGGYLLSSRNTYSENAVLTENFTRHSDFGAGYFTVTAVIEDVRPLRWRWARRRSQRHEFDFQEGTQQFQIRSNRMRNRQVSESIWEKLNLPAGVPGRNPTFKGPIDFPLPLTVEDNDTVMEFFQWLENTGFSTWVRESPSIFAFPVILLLHTVGMALCVGISAGINLRILGFAPSLRLSPLHGFSRFSGWVSG